MKKIKKQIVGFVIGIICGVIVCGLISCFDKSMTIKSNDNPTSMLIEPEKNNDNIMYLTYDENYNDKNKSIVELDQSIAINDLLNQEEDNYYVLFYLENCHGCEDVEDYLDKVDLSTTPEIYRFDCENINDNCNIYFIDDTSSNNGDVIQVKDYQSDNATLGIIGTPTLLKVTTFNGERIATYFVGFDNIATELAHYTNYTADDYYIQEAMEGVAIG